MVDVARQGIDRAIRPCRGRGANVARDRAGGGRGDSRKGDVVGTARLAGIQAAKRTDELIPLAHPWGSPTLASRCASTTRAGWSC